MSLREHLIAALLALGVMIASLLIGPSPDTAAPADDNADVAEGRP